MSKKMIAIGLSIVATVLVIAWAISTGGQKAQPCGDAFSRAETEWSKTCDIAK